MSKLKEISCLISIFLFLNSPAFANNSWKLKADSLFEKTEFGQASLYYEKSIAFEDLSNILRCEVLLKKSECYWNLNEYQNGLATLRRLDRLSINDSVLFQKKYKSIFHHLMLTHYDYVEFITFELLGKPVSEEMEFNLKTLLLINYSLSHNVSKFVSRYESYCKTYPHVVKDSIGSFNLNKYNGRRNVSTLMSAIVPGTGQFYAGKVTQGLVSATLVGSSASIVAFSLKKKYYFSAFASGVPLFLKFYLGGIRSVRRHYRNKQTRFNQQIINNNTNALLIQLKQ